MAYLIRPRSKTFQLQQAFFFLRKIFECSLLCAAEWKRYQTIKKNTMRERESDEKQRIVAAITLSQHIFSPSSVNLYFIIIVCRQSSIVLRIIVSPLSLNYLLAISAENLKLHCYRFFFFSRSAQRRASRACESQASCWYSRLCPRWMNEIHWCVIRCEHVENRKVMNGVVNAEFDDWIYKNIGISKVCFKCLPEDE